MVGPEFRTITELATPHRPGVPSHCTRCENDLYFVQCGADEHFRCFTCNVCFDLDSMFGLKPMHHTETGSVAAWSLPASWSGDEPPGGCVPGVMPTREESGAAIAAGIEEVIRERYG